VETNTVGIAAQFTWRMLFAMARFAWLGWGLPVALVFFMGLREIGTADFWWQWATGRHILENGIPTDDPWLTTAEPRPWIEMRWLYCIALYRSIESVGPWLPIIAVAAMYAAAVAFALHAGPKAAPSWFMGAGVAATAVMGRRLVVRPEAFTLLFLGVLLFLIVRVRQGRLNAKSATAWFFVIHILWANTHALFPLGWGICIAWLAVELVSKRDNRLTAAYALMASLAGSLVNPYFFDGVAYPFLLLQEMHVGAYRNNITELRSPLAFGITPSLIAHVLLAATILVLAIKKKGDAVLLLVCAATLYLSVTVVRNAPLFALAAAAYISTCDLKPARFVSWTAGIAAVAMAYSFAIGTWTLEDRIGFAIAEDRYPISSAKSLEGIDGEIFNTLVEGSLLIAQGDQAYCDPRLEVLPQERFLEMMAISRLQKPLPENFEYVLIRIDAPLAAKLVKEGGWQLLGIDSTAIALRRKAGHYIEMSGLKHLLYFHIPQFQPDFSLFRVSQSPMPYRRMAAFMRNLGDEEAASDLMQEARRVYPAR
jgi:hypothetical protein